MINISYLIDKEIQYLQSYIDKDFFEYDSYKNIFLDLVDMDAREFIDTVRKWDFSEMDNAIWHYARITLLEELFHYGTVRFHVEIDKTLEEE